MATLIRKRFARFGCLLALMVGTFASAASAETLMMPDREAVKGTQTVVWGVTTQANGTPYTIDFGDGSAQQSGAVADRSYIAFNYTYLLAGSPQVTATLTVGTGLGAEVATVKIQTWDPADPLVASQLRNININMTIQDGLRYLWVAQSDRANQFPANVMTHWDGTNPNSWTALVTLAFENQGYGIPNNNTTPTGLYQKYIVQRGLNYVINSLGKITSSPTAFQASLPFAYAGYPYNSYPACLTRGAFFCGTIYSVASGTQPAGDPRVGVPNDADLGVLLFGESIDRSAYGTSVAMLPIAASGAMNRTVSGIPGSGSGGFVVGRTYGEVLQRLSNGLVWGQIDSGSGQGGWMYALNPGPSNTIVASTSGGYASDGSTVGWGVLALLDAEAAGITVPAFAKSQFQIAYNNAINSDGSFDYNTDQNPVSNGAPNVYRNITRAGVGLEGLYYTGVKGGAAFAVNAPGQAALTFMADRWSGADLGDYTGTCAGQGAGQNKGCAYAMFNIFKGLKLQGVTTLPGPVFRPADATHAANDWYADYQDWLVANQTSANDKNGGYWGSMRFSCCANDTAPNSALAELVLSPVALVLPDATKFSTVGLSPATGTSPTGLTHTVTAHAESTGGAPVPSATVVFTVLTGPNTGKTGSSATDSSGNATFTYTDLGAGTDTIRAKIGTTLTSNTVTMNWTVQTVTASFTANNKVYDGNTGATVFACSLSNILPADVGNVACSLVASFSDANAGTAKTVSGSGIVLSGSRAANYALNSTTATTTADITPVTVTVTASSSAVTYGDPIPTVTPSGYSGFVNGENASALTTLPTCSTAYTPTSPVGGTPATSCAGAAAANYTFNYVSGTVTISPKGVTVTASSPAVTYGDAVPTITAIYAGFVNGQGASVLTTVPTCSTTYTPTSPVTSTPATTCTGVGAANYTFSYVSGTVTIAPKSVTVSASSAAVTYGDAAPTITASYGGFVNGQGASVLTTAPTCSTIYTPTSPVSGTPATSCTGAAAANYTFSYVAGAVTIAGKGVIVTASSAAVTYGDAVPTVTPTYNGFVNGENSSLLTTAPICSTTYTPTSPVGSTPATSCAGASAANYAFTYVAGAVTIAAKGVTVTASSAAVIYGDPVPTITASYAGFVNGQDALVLTPSATCSTTYTTTSPSGTPRATTCAGAASVNYTFNYVPGTVTVAKKTATVTAGGGAKVYGQSDPALSPATEVGFTALDAATIALTSTRVTGEAIGNYPTSASAGGAALANYTVISLPGSFSITPATVTVTAGGGTKVYGSADPTLTATTQIGLTAADIASVTLISTRAAGEPVANYVTTALATGAVLSNYTIVYAPGTFSITKAPLTVTANNVTAPHGVAFPAFTVSYSPFVNGDTPASLGGTLAFSPSATTASPAGDYSITPSGLTSPNYLITFALGQLHLTNEAPVAANDAYTTQWNTILTVPAPGVKVNDSDPNNDPLTAIKVTNTSHGTVTLNADGSLTYKPTANYSGADSFTYKVNDSWLDSNIATVRFTITSPCRMDDNDDRGSGHRDGDGDDHDRGRNGHRDGDGCEHDRNNHRRDHDDGNKMDWDDCKPGTPNSHSDAYKTPKNTALNVAVAKGVLKNDGRYATIAELYTAPLHGTVTLAANGGFIYTPATNFVGTDTFFYVPRSAAGVAGAVTSVTIKVSSHFEGDNDDHDRKRNGHRDGDGCEHDRARRGEDGDRDRDR